MIIRSESERRTAEEKIGYLKSELDRALSGQRDEIASNVISGLRMQVSDIESELVEYDRLKKGLSSTLTAESFDDVGELIIKARIARGWSQADLARELGMEPQQVQRYESNDWQKISLWRLQEVVEALSLRCHIYAYQTEGPGMLWPGAIYHTPVRPTTDVGPAYSQVAHGVQIFTVKPEDKGESADKLNARTVTQETQEHALVPTA